MTGREGPHARRPTGSGKLLRERRTSWRFGDQEAIATPSGRRRGARSRALSGPAGRRNRSARSRRTQARSRRVLGVNGADQSACATTPIQAAMIAESPMSGVFSSVSNAPGRSCVRARGSRRPRASRAPGLRAPPSRQRARARPKARQIRRSRSREAMLARAGRRPCRSSATTRLFPAQSRSGSRPGAEADPARPACNRDHPGGRSRRRRRRHAWRAVARDARGEHTASQVFRFGDW